MEDDRPEGEGLNNLIEARRILPRRAYLLGLPGIPLRMRLQTNTQANLQNENRA